MNSLEVRDLSEVDNNIPKLHEFKPLRSVGIQLPSHTSEVSPASIFKFFDANVFKDICDASNQYAEVHKSKPMYCHYSTMKAEDFYAMVGILVHLGYRKIICGVAQVFAMTLLFRRFLAEINLKVSLHSYILWMQLQKKFWQMKGIN